MAELAETTRMALVRCIQHQHAALAQLAMCLDDPACTFDRPIVNDCINAVTTAQSVVRRMLTTPSVTRNPTPC